MKKRMAVADAVGAIMLVLIIFAASMTIMLTVGSYFTANTTYNEIKEYESVFNEQSVAVKYVQALPPSGQPGLIITNHGTPVTLSYLVSEGSDSTLSFHPINKYLGYNQTFTLHTNNPYSGVMTSLGGLFMANWSPPSGYVPVSFVGVNISPDFAPELSFVQVGHPITYYTVPPISVPWYINGTYYETSNSITVTIEGPTAITAFGHSTYFWFQNP